MSKINYNNPDEWAVLKIPSGAGPDIVESCLGESMREINDLFAIQKRLDFLKFQLPHLPHLPEIPRLGDFMHAILAHIAPLLEYAGETALEALKGLMTHVAGCHPSHWTSDVLARMMRATAGGLQAIYLMDAWSKGHDHTYKTPINASVGLELMDAMRSDEWRFNLVLRWLKFYNPYGPFLGGYHSNAGAAFRMRDSTHNREVLFSMLHNNHPPHVKNEDMFDVAVAKFNKEFPGGKCNSPPPNSPPQPLPKTEPVKSGSNSISKKRPRSQIEPEVIDLSGDDDEVAPAKTVPLAADEEGAASAPPPHKKRRLTRERNAQLATTCYFTLRFHEPADELLETVELDDPIPDLREMIWKAILDRSTPFDMNSLPEKMKGKYEDADKPYPAFVTLDGSPNDLFVKEFGTRFSIADFPAYTMDVLTLAVMRNVKERRDAICAELGWKPSDLMFNLSFEYTQERQFDFYC